MVTRETWRPQQGQTLYAIDHGEVVLESITTESAIIRVLSNGSRMAVPPADLYPTEGTAVAHLTAEKYKSQVAELEIEIVETSENLASDKEWLRKAAVAELTALSKKRIDRLEELKKVDGILARAYARVR